LKSTGTKDSPAEEVSLDFLCVMVNEVTDIATVDPALGGNALVGPKGEALEDVTGAEPPTTQQAKGKPIRQAATIDMSI